MPQKVDKDKRVKELLGLTVDEVSFVDQPAVPRARIMMMKKLVEPEGDASLVPIVRGTISRLNAMRSELESAGIAKRLPDTVTDDIEIIGHNLSLIGTVMAGLDGRLEKCYDDFFEIDKDEMLLRDINFATSMMISLKGVFQDVADTLDGPSEALAAVSDQNLEALKGVADLLTEVVTGMQGASQVGKSVEKSEEDDPVPDEEKTDAKTDTPTGNEAILAAIAEMSAKFDAVSERLTILESTDDEETSDDTPDESDSDEDGDGEAAILLTDEEIDEALALFPTMTVEEQEAFQSLLEAQQSDFPYDGDDEPPATSDDGGGDEATA